MRVIMMGYPSGPDRLLALLDDSEARNVQARYGSSLQSLLGYLGSKSRIQPLTTQGNITFSSQVTGLTNPFSGPIAGMTTDAAGNLYMVGVNASSIGELLELAPPYTGTPTTVATDFINPQGVAIDGAGNLYVSSPTASNPLGGSGEVLKLASGCSTASCGMTL